ncbi:MAG: hypothetical protein WBD34_04100 [Burkholderiaceae bacterium]
MIKLPPILAIATAVACTPVAAVEVYGAVGLPGLVLGVAQPVSPSVVLRADIGGLPASLDGTRTEEGIDYDYTGSFNRIGVFADWYPAQNGFRLTGGLTFNNMGLDLIARPSGGTWNIGGQTYSTSPNDRFDVAVDFKSVTPYLGIGWGHHRLNASGAGWSFIAEFGLSIGKATVIGAAGGNLALIPGVQDSIDQELAELRDGVGDIRFIPQILIGAGYRF